MAYALVQQSLTRPPVEALERAFASGRGLTPADARFVADDAFGLLARNLELDDALFLQQSLGAEGVEVDVVPESDLPRLPDSQLFTRVECREGTLAFFDALDRSTEVACEAVAVIAAGYDQRELKLELFLANEPQRLSTTLELLELDRMRQYADLAEPDNSGEQFRNLVRHLVSNCPRARLNRAAENLVKDGLAGDVTEAITYPRPTAYTEELSWLLWRVRASSQTV
ncbi:MAG TPA: hypothetical protein PLX89_04995 [Verrucomicrobiota bacterium]|nr:hypothetical protein [Verrucomicrobiota bacterium]